MRASLKSEFLKLLTVRSTYIWAIIIFIFIAFGSIYIEGYSSAGAPLNSHKLFNVILSATGTFAQFAAIIPILLMSNEYRHNTITYTLTAVNSRNKALLSKFVTSSAYALVMGLICIILTVALTYIGIKIKGSHLPAQDINYLSVIAKSLYFTVAMSLLGLVIITITRNLVASIVITLIGFNTVEALLHLLLKDNSKYLPITSLQQVITNHGSLSPIKGALVFGGYLVVAWIVAWQLFLRRDAN